MATQLRRLELTFDNGSPAGAQATVEDGTVDEKGVWRRSGERTFGLDTGSHSEYAALADVAGAALADAIAANVELRGRLAAHETELEGLRDQLARAHAASAALQDQLDGAPAATPLTALAERVAALESRAAEGKLA